MRIMPLLDSLHSRQLASALLLTALAACGGGNSDGASQNQPAAISPAPAPGPAPVAGTAPGASTGAAAPTPSPTAPGTAAPSPLTGGSTITGVFAEPSGPLCSTVVANVCAEPTASSGVTEAQFRSLARDPSGRQVQLRRAGQGRSFHLKELYDRDGPDVRDDDYYVESSESYDAVDKTLVFGKNRIEGDGRVFNFSRILSAVDKSNPQAVFATSDPNDTVFLNELADNAPSFSMLKLTSNVPPAIVRGSTATFDSTSWAGGFYELITDRTIASLTPDHTIRYVGDIGFIGGNGQPVGGGQSINQTILLCPVSFTLDTDNGRISAINVSCSNEGATGTISVAPLTMRGSRITSLLQDEFSATATGPSSRTTLQQPASVTVQMKSNKVTGNVLGLNAQSILIFGSGPTGIVTITATRQ